MRKPMRFHDVDIEPHQGVYHARAVHAPAALGLWESPRLSYVLHTDGNGYQDTSGLGYDEWADLIHDTFDA